MVEAFVEVVLVLPLWWPNHQFLAGTEDHPQYSGVGSKEKQQHLQQLHFSVAVSEL